MDDSVLIRRIMNGYICGADTSMMRARLELEGVPGERIESILLQGESEANIRLGWKT